MILYDKQRGKFRPFFRFDPFRGKNVTFPIFLFLMNNMRLVYQTFLLLNNRYEKYLGNGLQRHEVRNLTHKKLWGLHLITAV